jgi:hypothetical protein
MSAGSTLSGFVCRNFVRHLEYLLLGLPDGTTCWRSAGSIAGSRESRPVVCLPQPAPSEAICSSMEHKRHLKVRFGNALITINAMELVMANTPSKDHRISDKEALRIAEQTDVSPNQAKDLAKEHGKAKAKEEARKTKDEG